MPASTINPALGTPAAPPPPAPPLIASTGNTPIDALAGSINRAVEPFQNAPPPEQGTLGVISHGASAVMGVVGAPFEMLDTGMALITGPLAALIPGFPAATLMAPHLGPPHTHAHPPSLIPPAPPVPLPSIGAVCGAGCLNVLVGGIPAARAGDIGMAPTCGGFAPAFEVWTGSSNTFFGGSRASRLTDMTRHCNPASALGKLGKAMGAAGAAVGALGAGAQAAGGNAQAAAQMAAQAAADAAALAMSALLGKDPGIAPTLGFLMFGNPTVLVGGLPLPDALEVISGAAGLLKALKKVKKLKRKKIKSQNSDCDRPGHPIDPVTGNSANELLDYQDPDSEMLQWERYYNSGWSLQDGPLGFGFRHNFQQELVLLRTRAIYIDARGRHWEFARQQDGNYNDIQSGYQLSQYDDYRFYIKHDTEGTMWFWRDDKYATRARLIRHKYRDTVSDFQYDQQHRLMQICHQYPKGMGQAQIDLYMSYDQLGHLTQIKRVVGIKSPTEVVRYIYDEQACLTQWYDALGESGSHGYDQTRRMIRETDRNQFSFYYLYNSEGKCIESYGQDGLWRVRLEYQPGLTKVTEADEGLWEFHYNEDNTVVKIVDPYGGTQEMITDDSGRIVKEIDSGKREKVWLYDSTGRHTGRINQWGHLIPTKSEQPNPPNPLARVLPETQIDIIMGTSIRKLDLSSGNQLPDNVKEISKKFQQRGADKTPLEYKDSIGRVEKAKDNRGYVERFEYDPEGNLTQRIDKDGKETLYSPTSWNLIGTETDGVGNTVKYEYTQREKIAMICDAKGNKSHYTYDFKDRLISVRRHNVIRERYTYDEGDRLIEKHDGDGNLLLSLEVGKNGLHSKRILSSGEEYSYEYDEFGHITNASSQDFEVELAFSQQGFVTLDKRDGLGVESKTRMGVTTTRYFDRFDIVSRVRMDGVISVKSPDGKKHRIHKLDKHRILFTLANGTNLLHHYDKDGNYTGQVSWINDKPQKLQKIQYFYSPAGDLWKSVKDDGKPTRYQYDDAHRITRVKSDNGHEENYRYDEAGNLISMPHFSMLSYIEGNRLDGTYCDRYQYNHRNHVDWHKDEQGVVTHYNYNSHDQLTALQHEDTEQEFWKASYDGLGRRINKQVGDQYFDFYWQDDRLAAEVFPNGKLRIYVYPAIDALVPFMFIDYANLEAEPDSGVPYYVFHDQIGMTTYIEDQQGEIVWRAESVSAYGALTVATESNITYNLRFPGHYYDSETGLHYNRYRYYDPARGRYIQSDPSGQSGGINLYAYTANPLVTVDLFGLSHNKKKNGDSDEADGEGRTPRTGESTDSGDTPPKSLPDHPNHVPDLPFTYKEKPFRRFVDRFNSEFADAGFDDVDAFMQGSAASGYKYNNGDPIPLDARRGVTPSDYDVAIVSPKLMQKADELGIDVRRGPLTPEQINQLGLSDAQDSLSRASKGGRPVNFKVYDSIDDVYDYDKTIPFSNWGS